MKYNLDLQTKFVITEALKRNKKYGYNIPDALCITSIIDASGKNNLQKIILAQNQFEKEKRNEISKKDTW